MNMVFRGFPQGITELILLRFLAIACEGSIPPSIRRLENLETPCMQTSSQGSVDLPLTTIWEMQKLKHVHAKSIKIPKEICDGIPTWENVQSIAVLCLFYGVESEILLRKMPNVQKLRCVFEVSSTVTNLVVKLDFLTHLESLDLSHFTIRFPCHFHCPPFSFPKTLKKLTLKAFLLPWSEISLIAKLPNLEVLKLHSPAFDGNTWKVGDEEFEKLKFLRLRWMNIANLDASDESFPCLQHLQLDHCDRLKEIPSRFGSISTLKIMQVQNCRSAINSSVTKIREAQKEFGNEGLEVLISGAW